jgi:hypothetical protein
MFIVSIAPDFLPKSRVGAQPLGLGVVRPWNLLCFLLNIPSDVGLFSWRGGDVDEHSKSLNSQNPYIWASHIKSSCL